MIKNIKEHTYYVRGMHCAFFEILIKKKLLELGNIKSVEASTAKGEVLIEYGGEKPTHKKLNGVFKKEGYIFPDQPKEAVNGFKPKEFFINLGIGLLIIIGFIGLNKLGLSGSINVSLKSSLPWKKIQPHLIFNAGRLISCGVLGAVLEVVGSKLNFSLNFGPILVISISVLMIFLVFQMFGFKGFRKFQFTMPRFITRFIANESNFKGRYMPFLIGAFTFFQS